VVLRLTLPPSVGGVALPLHLVFEVLAYTLGFRYFLRLRARGVDRIADLDRLWIFLAAAGGGFVGARLLGALEHHDVLLALPRTLASLPAILAVKTIVGGLLGGLVAVEWAKRRLGVTASSGDLMVYPLLLALCLGRVGCFLSGAEDGTHGLPTALPWAIDVGDGVPRHPTALYEIAFLVGLWALLRRRDAQGPLPDGRRFQIFLAAYLLFRLLVEPLKPRAPLVLGLSAIQLACVAGLIYYRRLLLLLPWPTATTSSTTSL